MPLEPLSRRQRWLSCACLLQTDCQGDERTTGREHWDEDVVTSPWAPSFCNCGEKSDPTQPCPPTYCASEREAREERTQKHGCHTFNRLVIHLSYAVHFESQLAPDTNDLCHAIPIGTRQRTYLKEGMKSISTMCAEHVSTQRYRAPHSQTGTHIGVDLVHPTRIAVTSADYRQPKEDVPSSICASQTAQFNQHCCCCAHHRELKCLPWCVCRVLHPSCKASPMQHMRYFPAVAVDLVKPPATLLQKLLDGDDELWTCHLSNLLIGKAQAREHEIGGPTEHKPQEQVEPDVCCKINCHVAGEGGDSQLHPPLGQREKKDDRNPNGTYDHRRQVKREPRCKHPGLDYLQQPVLLLLHRLMFTLRRCAATARTKVSTCRLGALIFIIFWGNNCKLLVLFVWA